jgi:putative flippase GtrA
VARAAAGLEGWSGYPATAMSDDATVAPPLPLSARVRHGVRHPDNWLQLLRFGTVGASGYVVNLAVFTLAVHLLALDYRLAAALAFATALMNNFWWNRHWTFRARDGHVGFQGMRFVTVSLAAFALNLAVLDLLVRAGGLAEVPAQAIAIACAMPLSFIGNKLWSFRL